MKRTWPDNKLAGKRALRVGLVVQYVVQAVNNGALGVGFRTYNAPRTFGVTVARRW